MGHSFHPVQFWSNGLQGRLQSALFPANSYVKVKHYHLIEVFQFSYNLGLLKQGRKAEIEEKDIYAVIPEYGAERLGDQLEDLWRQQKKHSKNPSVIKCLVSCFGWSYFSLSVAQLLLTTFTM